MASLVKSMWRCRYLCRWTNIRIFKSHVLKVSLYGNRDLWLGDSCRCHWNQTASQNLEASLEHPCVKPATTPWSWIETCYQLSPWTLTPRLYEHAERHPDVDPAHKLFVDKKDKTTPTDGNQGDAHVSHDLGESANPAGTCLECVGQVRRSLFGRSAGSMRPRMYAPFIDVVTHTFVVLITRWNGVHIHILVVVHAGKD